METLDPYVQKAQLEYQYLKNELFNEVERFEALKKEHQAQVAQLTRELMHKRIELENLKEEARHG